LLSSVRLTINAKSILKWDNMNINKFKIFGSKKK
jgi:hypothetical protein